MSQRQLLVLCGAFIIAGLTLLAVWQWLRKKFTPAKFDETGGWYFGYRRRYYALYLLAPAFLFLTLDATYDGWLIHHLALIVVASVLAIIAGCDAARRDKKWLARITSFAIFGSYLALAVRMIDWRPLAGHEIIWPIVITCLFYFQVLAMLSFHAYQDLRDWIPIWRAMRLKRKYGEGCCMHCGYNLTGNASGRCSECGHAVPHWLRENSSI